MTFRNIWLKDWDKELGKRLRTILLIVDNAGPPPPLTDLKNITLEFLSPNTTSHSTTQYGDP